MISVRGGNFYRGNEQTREVSLSSFLISETEVTQALWKSVMNENPSGFVGDDRPVDSVSWLDAVRFCNALSEKAGLPPAYVISGSTVTWNRQSRGFRLPTEAEWEFAARGGALGAQENESLTNAGYAGGSVVGDVGWYEKNSGRSSKDVKGKLPNELGLYDMSGNVWEWCWDWYGDYPRDPLQDPQGPDSGRDRVLRGGAWFTSVNLLRVNYRYWNAPAFKANTVGFRIAQNG
jgi:formylglycine-generating enzyme required for sulfatase activity